MVTYAAENLNGNKTNVAVTGSSSGAVMVQVLAGLYPDYFQAASVYSGVYQETIDEGYTGTRPKMMMFVLPAAPFVEMHFTANDDNFSYHGTADETYAYSNLAEELDGWSAILDVTFTDNTSFVIPDYTEMVYGDGLKLVGISAAGVGHTVPVNAVEDMVWFCISPKCGSDGLPITSSTSSISLATSTTASGSSPTNTDGATTQEPAKHPSLLQQLRRPVVDHPPN
jgi:acetylxylan esterase